MNIQIVADSSCDLPVHLVKNAKIDIIPVPITDGISQFQDGIDIIPQTMYENMKKDIVYKTSQIPLATYIEKYTYYAENDIPMLSLVMSSGLSSSHSTSQLAIDTVKEKYPHALLYSVDSKCCSLGFGVAVYTLAKVAPHTKNISSLLDVLSFVQENLISTSSLDDLKYVARGGRLPNVAAKIANTLHIKPFLHADDGYLHMFDKVRGRKKVIKKYIDILYERNESTDFKNSTIWLENSDDTAILEDLKEAIKEEFSLKDSNFILGTIGCTIGAHIGPGSMCMFFLKNPLPKEFS